MNKNKILSCPQCQAPYTLHLEEPSAVICHHCAAVVAEWGTEQQSHRADKAAPMPDDWSFVQIGTTGVYEKKAFEIVGRLRLQLRNDYKNFWCAARQNGTGFWIVESFASFSMFELPWLKYNDDPKKLRAGGPIPVGTAKALQGEYVEKCESLACQGELAAWTSFNPGFFLVQGSNDLRTAVFLIQPDHDETPVRYLPGQKVTAAALNLTNTIEWNEWK